MKISAVNVIFLFVLKSISSNVYTVIKRTRQYENYKNSSLYKYPRVNVTFDWFIDFRFKNRLFFNDSQFLLFVLQ